MSIDGITGTTFRYLPKSGGPPCHVFPTQHTQHHYTIITNAELGAFINTQADFAICSMAPERDRLWTDDVPTGAFIQSRLPDKDKNPAEET